MATYNPPTEDLVIFDRSVFHSVNGDTITTATLDANYLKYPIAQGTETIPDLVVGGGCSVGGNLGMGGNISFDDGLGNTGLMGLNAGNLEITSSGNLRLKTTNTTQNATHYLNFSDSFATGHGFIQKSANFSCNPSTGDFGVNGTLTATLFSGPATRAQTIDITNTDANSTYYPTFVSASGNGQTLYVDNVTTSMTYNANQATLNCGSYVASTGTYNNSSTTGNCALFASTQTGQIDIGSSQTTPALNIGGGSRTSGIVSIMNGPNLNGATLNLASNVWTGASGVIANVLNGAFTTGTGTLNLLSGAFTGTGILNIMSGSNTGTGTVNIGNASTTTINVKSASIYTNKISTSNVAASNPTSALNLGYTNQVASSGWTTALTANTQTNITSVAFTSAIYGTYLFQASLQITPTDNTVARQQILGISTTTANYGNFFDLQYTTANVGYNVLKVSRVINIYADTTVYLVGYNAGTNGTVVTTGSPAQGIFTYTRIA